MLACLRPIANGVAGHGRLLLPDWVTIGVTVDVAV